MPSSKKPRKRYRPRQVILDNTTHVLQGLSLLAPSTVQRVLTVNHDCMANLTKGNGTKEDWRKVCDALNIGTVLDELVFQSAYADDFQNAIQAHANCGARAYQGKNFGFTGPELQSVNMALAVHDEQLQRATVKEVENAMVEVNRRIQLNSKKNISVIGLVKQKASP